MANLMNPADIATAYQGGLLFGQQQRDRKRMEGEREQLRNLAPQIMQGDPAAYTQAAAINPEAAGQYQSAGDQQYRRLMNVSKMMRDAISTGNPTAKQRAFQTIKPFLSQMAPGRPIPEQWDDSLLPGFEQFENRISMAQAAGGPAGGANKVVGGSLVGPNGEVLYEAPNKGQIVSVNDGSGGTVQMIFDPVTRALSPLNAGQSGTVFTDANGEPLDVSGVEDPVVRRQIMENPSAYGLIPDGGSARIPEQRGGLGYAPPKPEISAVDQERLRLDQERLNLLREEANRKASAPSPAAQKASVAQSTKLPQINNVERGLDRIDSALKGLSGSVVNTGPLDQYVVRNLPSGQELEAAIGGIQNSLLALTRVPGVGSQSDLEAKIAALQYPSLDKDPEVNRRTLANLREFVADLKRQIDTSSEAPRETEAVQRARNPQTGEVLVLRNGQWVPE